MKIRTLTNVSLADATLAPGAIKDVDDEIGQHLIDTGAAEHATANAKDGTKGSKETHDAEAREKHEREQREAEEHLSAQKQAARRHK